MLQYMGTRQPPRKYNVPPNGATTLPKNPCDICTSRTWTKELFATIRNAPLMQARVSVQYHITTEELRNSVINGCRFCRTLADGVHGKVFLDELYERFERTDSWPGSEVASVEASTYTDDGDVDKSPEEVESEWNDASAFDAEEINDDVTGGWDAWEDRDTLVQARIFSIELSFERGEADLFTFVNARIEATAENMDYPDELQKLQELQGEKAVELRYHVNVDGGHTSSTERPFPKATMNSALGTEVNMQSIEAWYRSLGLATETATEIATQAPSRLIELLGKNELRVVDTSNTVQYEKRFAALSYVWGANQTFVLLSTSKHMLTMGFKIEQLPQTIQDAITVTRRIGLRYIWIDALCIMQDSDADKARELPKMGSIYKYAAVTIVASVANSATKGFLHHVEEKYDYFIDPVTIPIPKPSTSTTQSSVILSYPADYKRWKDPINERAWTFQELLLSTRAILFSYRGVQFFDRTTPVDVDGHTSGKDPQLPNLPWSGNMFSLATSPENTRQVWLAVRGEYSRRALSYQGDKLLAVAAIAEELGRKYHSRYLAGLWERDLVMDLQWSCSRDQNRSDGKPRRMLRAKDYVAPSWSWASVDGAVDDFVHVWEDEGDNGGIGIKGMLGFEVVSCDVTFTVPDFAYGAVTSGVLTVKGRICSFTWRPHKNDDFHNSLDSDGFLARRMNTPTPLYSELKCGEATVDALDLDLKDGVEVSCLATRLIENVPGRQDVEGLMLLAVDKERYRRVGFIRLTGPSGLTMFKARKAEQISII